MLKGIYKSASGMIPQIKKQEITANNIANASTPGYKKDDTFIKELDTFTKSVLPRKSDWETPMIDQVYTDFSQGTFNKTGNSLDVAIEGEGFFILETIDGIERRYTRNGNFAVDTEGFLVSADGLRVIGGGGPLEVGAGTIDIDETGELMVDGASVGRLQVVDFEDKSTMVKVDGGGFSVPNEVAPIPPERFSIRQGYLEKANLDVIKEMVGMIITLRSFETGARMIQSQDESLRTLLTQVGRTTL